MIYALFSNALAKTPHQIALITSLGQTFTYAQIDEKVRCWALFLLKQAIQTGDRVAVLLDNEDQHLFILLALDLIGATYVPFDTDIPKGQLALDIADLGLKKFLIDNTLSEEFSLPQSLQIVLTQEILNFIETSTASQYSLPYHANPHKVEYLVSSSGSTGKKKWIPILGGGLAYWDLVIKKQFVDNPFTSFLATRSPAYDARIFEYLCSFSLHARLKLLNRKERKDFPSILKSQRASGEECLLLIASQLGSENSQEVVPLLKQTGLKHLMVTGDACTPALKNLCEKEGIILWNCYGPTEATFGLSILAVNGLKTYQHEGRQLVPIAPPLTTEVKAHLIQGQLCIESPYLTPGYLNEASNEKVFRTITDAKGRSIRVFDTGDLFCEEEGFFYYQGRYSLDSHCKINGVKVSPYTIEQCILDYKTSKLHNIQAAVVIKEHLGYSKPFAYIEYKAEDFDKHAFLDYLQTRLKKEEIPLLYILPRLPRLPTSQKIDIQQLIKRQDSAEEAFFYLKPGVESLLPSEECKPEEKYSSGIKKIWQQLLRNNSIPNDAEFIFLGGDSLLAVEMVKRINAEWSLEYSYTQLLSLKKITIQTVAQSLLVKNTISADQALIHALVIEEEAKGNMFCLPPLTA